MADYPCDGECGAPASMTLQAHASSDVTFLCPRCLPMFALATFKAVAPEDHVPLLEAVLSTERPSLPTPTDGQDEGGAVTVADETGRVDTRPTPRTRKTPAKKAPQPA